MGYTRTIFKEERQIERTKFTLRDPVNRKRNPILSSESENDDPEDFTYSTPAESECDGKR